MRLREEIAHMDRTDTREALHSVQSALSDLEDAEGLHFGSTRRRLEQARGIIESHADRNGWKFKRLV